MRNIRHHTQLLEGMIDALQSGRIPRTGQRGLQLTAQCIVDDYMDNYYWTRHTTELLKMLRTLGVWHNSHNAFHPEDLYDALPDMKAFHTRISTIHHWGDLKSKS